MPWSSKIIEFDELSVVDDKVSVCYGHFDSIHPGHIRYLQYAKSLSNHLIVALIADHHHGLTNSPHNFSEDERAASLANLHIVDQVVILNNISLSEFISRTSPDILLLGVEFEKSSDKEICTAVNEVKNQNGKVLYHSGEVHHANSDLLHGNISDLGASKKHRFQQICSENGISHEQLLKIINKYNDTKLLVIGDSIVDHYVACDALGMSAEAPVIVVKELESQNYIGGAAIVASHIRALGANCHYISVVGNDKEADFLKNQMEKQNITIDLVPDISRPTTYKTRYMVDNQKLFRVSRVKEHKISKEVEDLVIDKLKKELPNMDGVIVSDFSYGVLTNNILDTIRADSKKYDVKVYGDSQCSSQTGDITKFMDFDLITPTEKEVRLSLRDEDSGIELIANKIIDKTNSKNLLITLGSEGFILYERDHDNSLKSRQHFPALSANPVDTTGAGDSLLAAMSVTISSGGSLRDASVIGVCMSSCAVEEVGNKGISKQKLENRLYKLLLDN